MSVRRVVGNGDMCPLFPDHGAMYTIMDADPPKQYCASQEHDGGLGSTGIPRSRAIWPLYGFEETLSAYLARLDREIRQAELPDLSEIEVL